MTTVTGPDGKLRCKWCSAAPDFLHYHDTEWGFPVADDRRLFEKLSLEGFQSGLSWRTILAKRDNFRAAFHDFDIDRIARFSERDVTRLLKDASIVRHRGKIEAVAMVTHRIRPFQIGGRPVHMVGLPWCFGWHTPGVGDAANLLTPTAGDANTMIPETKAFMVGIARKG